MAENSDNNNLSTMFRALGDQTRYTLTEQLVKNQGACVSELAETANISVAGVSQQLKVLEQAGVIQRVRDGQKVCYELNVSDPNVKKLIQLM